MLYHCMSLCSYIPMANVLGVEKMEPRCDIDSQLHQHGRRYGGVRFVPAAFMAAFLMGRALLWARAVADAMLVASPQQGAPRHTTLGRQSNAHS